ncbi:MAG: phosphoribulokinase [Panacagrimonas sp.]
MSARHPIVGITGSSGAGTSTAVKVLKSMFEKMQINATLVEGDAFHAYDREGSRQAIERARIRGENFSLFGPAGNHLDRLEKLLADYGRCGSGMTRHYLHTEAEAAEHNQLIGTFTPWEPLPEATEFLLYEGLHGGYQGDDADIASHMDLLLGVTPVINLEWIQKIRRDTAERGHQATDVMRTILRRMPDYVNYIVPQFSRTDINFQRVPLVDTSNPFEVREIPPPEESLIVIHINENGRLSKDLLPRVQQVPNALRSNPQTLIVPGPQMAQAMEVILGPSIRALAQRRQDATRTAPGDAPNQGTN